jgi:hypothetical protein
MRLKKQMKHCEQTLAIYVHNHCNICNIPIYFCNIRINTYNIPLKHLKHLQHTLLTQHLLIAGENRGLSACEVH